MYYLLLVFELYFYVLCVGDNNNFDIKGYYIYIV